MYGREAVELKCLWSFSVSSHADKLIIAARCIYFSRSVDYLSWLQWLCPTANGSQWSKRQLANEIPLRVRAVSVCARSGRARASVERRAAPRPSADPDWARWYGNFPT